MAIGGGVNIKAFVFTSLLTIPTFDNIPLYAIAVLAAFTTSMLLVILLDYRTPEDKAAARAKASGDADATTAEAPADTAAAPAGAAAAGASPAEDTIEQSRVEALFAGLGGRDNVTTLENVASTRLRVEVRDSSLVDLDALNSAGVAGAAEVVPGVWHVILGQEASAFAKASSLAEASAK
mgnify:FL=1